MISNRFLDISFGIIEIFRERLVMIMTMDLINFESFYEVRSFKMIVNSGSWIKISWYLKSAEIFARVLAAARSTSISYLMFESKTDINVFKFL